MSWSPTASSSQAGNRWRPPSPSPETPLAPSAAALKRESWRPTNTWSPVARVDQPRQLPLDPSPGQHQQPEAREPLPERRRESASPSPPPTGRDQRGFDEDASYDRDRRGGYGDKRDRRGGGSGAADGERSWEAWKSKVDAASTKRPDDDRDRDRDRDRRGGPSRRDREDYTTFDRKREAEDQAAGRSWSAWKSKIGVDDRRGGDRKQPDISARHRDRDVRDRDEGWRSRRRGEDEGWKSKAGKTKDEDVGRTWAAWKEKVGGKAQARDDDDRPDSHDRAPPPRRRRGDDDRPHQADDKVALPYSPVDRSRSPAPPARKRSPSPVRRERDREEPPRRGGARRASPDYGAPRTRQSHSPSPPRRAARDRRSPDYGLGAEGRGAGREANGNGDRRRSPVPNARGRSPSPPPRRRDYIRPRSDSISSSSSSASSIDDRPARRPLPRDRSQERRPGSPADRYKRPRRDSPDYAPRTQHSPGKAPLPPQDAMFSNERPRNGSFHAHAAPIPPRTTLAAQFNDAQSRNQVWSREPVDERPRPPRRGSPDYEMRDPAGDSRRNGPQQPYYNDRRPPPSSAAAPPVESRWPGVPLHSAPGPSYSSAPQPPMPFVPPQNQAHGHAPQLSYPPPYLGYQSQGDGPSVSLPVNGSTSPVKIDFGASPTKLASTAIPDHRPAGLRQFFETDSPDRSNPSNDTAPVQAPTTGERGPTTGIDSALKPDPELQRPEDYLHQIAESENKYTQHLSTIAPYVRNAFKEWMEQDQGNPLPAFLVHYFGRQPDQRELHQIEQLIAFRQETSKAQAGLRDLHAQATRNDRSAPHSAPRDVAMDCTQSGRNSSLQSPGSVDRTRDAAADPPPSRAAAPISAAEGIADEPNVAVRPAQPDEAYERLACVGEGTYGKVYKARRHDDGVFVALKRIRMEVEKDGFPVTAMREIKLLQSLKHDNVIRLHEMMVSKGSVYMVFDYMEHDLTGVLSHPGISFTPANLKSLNHQMLAGLGYLHQMGILHRDMKGSNILLNAQGDLKLADFGLARLYNRKRRADYTNRVITLWYRSPELLLGETAYGPEVDMWSAGCIMLEMFCTKPILQGNDEIHQLEVIYGLMGTPREDDWPEVRELPWYELVKPKEQIRSKFTEAFAKRLSPAALELAEGLLAMNPAKRLSAKNALQTAYFTSEEPSMEKPQQLAGIGEHHEMSAKQERHRRKAEGH